MEEDKGRVVGVRVVEEGVPIGLRRVRVGWLGWVRRVG